MTSIDFGAPVISPRLRPYDGLFVQSRHFDQIQDYAASRIHAMALAGGTGVVSGLGVTLTADNRVVVESGLAVDLHGRLVSLTTRKSYEPPAARKKITVWAIVLQHGTELVAQDGDRIYGQLCGHRCDGDASKEPKSLVVGQPAVKFVELDLHDDADPMKLRSHFATLYFEYERQISTAGRPHDVAWDATPGLPDSLVVQARDAVWDDGTPIRSGDQGVPLGLIWYLPEARSGKAAAGWGIDQWAARRERLDEPNRSALGGRLGMRPWSVFMAQIHQFQAQQRSAKRDGEYLSESFVELPPAGYFEFDKETARPDLTLSDALGVKPDDLALCYCDVEYVARAIEEAQHLPRTGISDVAALEILVPDRDLGLSNFRTGRRDRNGAGVRWVGFRRRSGCAKGEEPPQVTPT